MPADRLDLDSASTMSLGEHIEDLRRRLILAVGGLIPIVVLALAFGQELLELLIAPVQRALTEASLNPTLQATGPIETFATYFKIALIAAILGGSPWLLYQLWRFVAPGLYAQEKRFVYLLLPMSTALTAAGVFFLYAVILPVVLGFFISFGSGLGERSAVTGEPPIGTVFGSVPVLVADPPAPEIGHEWINTSLSQRRVCVGYEGESPVVLGSDLTRAAGIAQQYRVSEYTGLFLSLALAFAVGFQTPVVVLLLGWSGLIERETIVRYRKQIVMGCVVASAFLTPADPVSMVLLAGPLYLLFELGALLLILLPAERVARGLTKPSIEPDERSVSSSAPGPWRSEPDDEDESDDRS